MWTVTWLFKRETVCGVWDNKVCNVISMIYYYRFRRLHCFMCVTPSRRYTREVLMAFVPTLYRLFKYAPLVISLHIRWNKLAPLFQEKISRTIQPFWLRFWLKKVSMNMKNMDVTASMSTLGRDRHISGKAMLCGCHVSSVV